MKLRSRCTSKFVEITVDEINTTIFESNQDEVKKTIINLLDVAEDLLEYFNDGEENLHSFIDRYYI